MLFYVCRPFIFNGMETSIAAVRKELIARRKALSSEYIKEKSLKMTADITNDPLYKECHYLYAYSPINNEIDTNYLIVKALQDDKVVCLPIMLSSGDMVFGQVNKTTSFRREKHQILEPVLDPKIIVDRPGLMIVPLVGFCGRKRIGYGMQYYNNYLATRRDIIHTIGVAYDFQENKGIDFDDRDIDLDEIRSY